MHVMSGGSRSSSPLERQLGAPHRRRWLPRERMRPSAWVVADIRFVDRRRELRVSLDPCRHPLASLMICR